MLDVIHPAAELQLKISENEVAKVMSTAMAEKPGMASCRQISENKIGLDGGGDG